MNIPQSPFAVGRPLKATEPLFGREETFTLTHAALDRFSGNRNIELPKRQPDRILK